MSRYFQDWNNREKDEPVLLIVRKPWGPRSYSQREEQDEYQTSRKKGVQDRPKKVCNSGKTKKCFGQAHFFVGDTKCNECRTSQPACPKCRQPTEHTCMPQTAYTPIQLTSVQRLRRKRT